MANLKTHPKKQFCKYGHDTHISGRTKSGQCIICNKQYYKINRTELLFKQSKNRSENLIYYRQKAHDFSRSLKGKFRTLKRNAKARNLKLGFSFDQYSAIVNKAKCFYCDGLLPEAGSGLDRLDNSRGYLLDNVVPCCEFCNYLRSDMLTPEETKVAVLAIKQLRLNKILNNMTQEVK